MIISIFGDLEFNDPSGWRAWLAAHDLKHQALAQALARGGVQTQGFLLADQIDDAWLLTHDTTHSLLARQFIPNSDSSTYSLLQNPNSDESTFEDWHNTHDLIHQSLDQALGISGT